MCAKVESSSKESQKKKKRVADLDEVDVVQEIKNKKSKEKGTMASFERKSKQTTKNQIFRTEEHEKFSQQIAKFFYASGIPLNCVNNPEFGRMLEMIANYGTIIGDEFEPPSYHEIRGKLLRKEVDKTLDMLQKHRENLKKTAEKIFEVLDEVVEKVGEENVEQVVTDHTTNYELAGKMLVEKRKRLTSLLTCLKHFTNGKGLIRPAATRFATTYLTSACLHELKGALITMFSSDKWKLSRSAASQEGKRIEAIVIYQPVWDIIDQRWQHHFHSHLHAAAYHLNPHYHYSDDFNPDVDIKLGLYSSL
ncbi:hypothetical protein SO802_025123 [Lithocarpus litseifolius]|uniref:DUF659 domain-containing protein n=1 Tax=Lithocarpus litseifolius TaxID=425828 RepID=A0AAW2BXZ9_9ROSI